MPEVAFTKRDRLHAYPSIILVRSVWLMSATPSASPRQHAFTETTAAALPEPSHAERVRTLLSLASLATLSTQSRKHPGFPFGSLMPFALDLQGRPLLLISNMAMHTQNLRAEPRASLFVTNAGNEDDPLGAARATLVGEAFPVPEPDIGSAREQYLAQHPGSSYWIDFTDFSMFRFEPVDFYYVGGFGVMGWVNAEDYRTAAPDPLARSAAAILAHMNSDHVAAMILLARTQSAVEASEATMTAVDRLGFTLRLKTAAGMKSTRINFPVSVSSAEQTRAVLVQMVRAAAEPQTYSSPGE